MTTAAMGAVVVLALRRPHFGPPRHGAAEGVTVVRSNMFTSNCADWTCVDSSYFTINCPISGN